MRYLKWEDFHEDEEWNLLDELLMGKDFNWIQGNSITAEPTHEFTRNDVMVCQNPEYDEDGFHWILTNFRNQRKMLGGLYGGKMVIDYDIYDYNYDDDGFIIGWDRVQGNEHFSGGFEKETKHYYPIDSLRASLNPPNSKFERAYLLNVNLNKKHNYLNWVDETPWVVKE